MANDSADQLTNPQAATAGGSKDALFGWLVGRAAADLGLAQALAASEAQRAEQFRALEAGLLAQIHELRHAPSTPAQDSDHSDEFARLKTEMYSLLERMGGFESAAQKFVQTPEILRNEMASLQAQLGERQGATEMQNSRLATTADALAARLDRLEERQATKLEITDCAVSEIAELKTALQPLADRLARIEFASQTTERNLADEIARVENLAAERMRSELAAFKSKVMARLNELSEDALAQRFDQMIENRVGDLPARIEQNARVLTQLAADHAAFRAEMQNLSKQVETVAAVPGVDIAAERERRNGEVDERIAAGLREIAEHTRHEARAIVDSKADRDSVATQLAGLAERLSRIEGAVNHASVSVGQELNSIKTELSRQQGQLQPAAELLQSVEETLRAKIAAIQDYLGCEQQNARTRELQFREFEIQLQRLTQRLNETESLVQQTHALVVNEGAQAAQQRETLTAELVALRADISDPRSRAVVDRVEENLRGKIHDLQTQLAQHTAGLARRDEELLDLKAQVKSMAGQAPPSEHPLASSLFPVTAGIPEKAAPELELAAEAPPQNRPSTAPTLTAVTGGAQPPPRADGEWALALPEAQDPHKLLHERMSADIERARAELREKSGRWKIRR